jgi:hypothetical protein
LPDAAGDCIAEEVVSARPVATDPDIGIPDLIRRLSTDSKRLVTDEVRLARLEAKDAVQTAAKGALWMTLAFGVGVVMMVALTVFLASLIGRIANGHVWIGALVTGVVELAVGGLLIKKGLSALTEPSYSFEASRAALADTKNWSATLRKEQ